MPESDEIRRRRGTGKGLWQAIRGFALMKENPVVVSSIIEDAFLISCLTLALQNSETAIQKNPEADIFLDDCQDSIESMLLKRLLAISGLLRNTAFEKFPSEARNEEWERLTNREVGLLIDEKGEHPLVFRESCNKILHHTSYEFPASVHDQRVPKLLTFSLQDCAQFSGIHRKEEWHAILNLHQFASAAYFCADIKSKVL